MHFSALLAATVTIHGFGEQKVALALHGDNMMPGRNSLGAPKIAVPHDCLAVISRDGTSIPKTLSLTLKEPCSLRYPRSLAGSVAEPSTPCRQLVTLANTTNIDILFDSQWLTRGLAQLHSALRYASQLAAVPVPPRSAHANTYLQASSSVLRFVNDIDAAQPSIEIDAAPPPYERAGPSSKRQRPSQSRTPTPDRQLSKRRLQHDARALPQVQRGSPRSTPSATETSDTVEHDTLQEIVLAAVKKALPDALRDASATDTLQALVESAVREQLPGILENILPRMIRRARVLGLRPPLHPAPPPPPVVIVAGPLSQYIRAHISSAMNTAAYNAITAIENRAGDHHERVSATLDDELADHLEEVKCVRDMHLTEFERDCEKKREKLKEQIKAIKETVVDEVDKYEDAMLEKIEKMKTAAEVEMQLRHEFACRRFSRAKQKETTTRQRRRAQSL